MAPAEEVTALRKQVRGQEKENEFLEEASVFFAAGRRKSGKSGGCVNDTYGRKRMYQALLLRQPELMLADRQAG